MISKEIQTMINNYHDFADEYKPLVDTGRKYCQLQKYPDGLDFSKSIGGTTYIVKSYFNQNAGECLLVKIHRLLDGNSNFSE